MAVVLAGAGLCPVAFDPHRAARRLWCTPRRWPELWTYNAQYMNATSPGYRTRPRRKAELRGK